MQIRIGVLRPPLPYMTLLVSLSLISDSVLIGYTAGYQSLNEALGFLLMPLLWLMVWALFLGSLFWSFAIGLFAAFDSPTTRIFPLLPFLINSVVLIIALTVPFATLMRQQDFHHNLVQRMEVVKLVEMRQLPLTSAQDQLIVLPQQYQYLSKGGGEIVVARKDGTTTIFFYTFRGILDNFAGFLYRSDDSPPQPHDLSGDFRYILKLQDHWYWASSW